MSHLMIPDLEDAVLARLRERARQHGRTVETEAKEILLEALPPAIRPDQWAAINALRDELATNGRTFPDSTDSIREDRAR